MGFAFQAQEHFMQASLRTRLTALAWAAACTAALAPGGANAQAAGSVNWRYALSVYGYFPSVDGQSNIPTGPGGGDLNISSGNFMDKLQGAFMGSFGAHNGRWGVFTDFIYLDFGDSRSGSRDFSIGNAGLPASTSANLGLDLKAKLWTLGADYRIAPDPALTVDVLGGVRMLDINQSVRWDISGALGSIAPASRSGSYESSQTLWDALVGVKGRYALDSAGKWAVPFYLDVGAGESRLTWQAATGISSIIVIPSSARRGSFVAAAAKVPSSVKVPTWIS